MRLGTFMVVLFITYLTLGMLNKTMDPTLQNFAGTSTGATFLQILTQPWLWNSNGFLLLLTLAVFGVSAITAAASFLTRSDILTLAGLAGVFFSMGAVPIISLYDFMSRNIGQFAECVPNMPCAPATVIATLTAGVVALMWSMTVLEWWMWRPATQ